MTCDRNAEGAIVVRLNSAIRKPPPHEFRVAVATDEALSAAAHAGVAGVGIAGRKTEKLLGRTPLRGMEICFRAEANDAPQSRWKTLEPCAP